MKFYTIGQKRYYQIALTAGQKAEVLNLLAEMLNEMSDEVTDQESGQKIKQFNLSLDRMAGALRGDYLGRFMGIILIEEGQLPRSLASVLDFAERGKALLFEMQDEVEVEILEDFFGLNKLLVQKIAQKLGLDLDALSSAVSVKVKTASEESSSSSRTDGAKTPENSPSATP